MPGVAFRGCLLSSGESAAPQKRCPCYADCHPAADPSSHVTTGVYTAPLSNPSASYNAPNSRRGRIVANPLVCGRWYVPSRRQTSYWTFAKCELNHPSPSGRGAGGEGLVRMHKPGRAFLGKQPSPQPSPRGGGGHFAKVHIIDARAIAADASGWEGAQRVLIVL